MAGYLCPECFCEDFNVQHLPNCSRIKETATIGARPVKFTGGVTSSSSPRFELIPLSGSTALALRFEYGILRQGDGAWNALSTNQAAATDKAFVLNRLGHAVKHCQEAIAKIAGTLEEDQDDKLTGGDAGAIMFAGALLAEYLDRKLIEK